MDSATLRVRRSIQWTRAAPARAEGWRLVVRKPSLLGIAAGAMATIVADAGAQVWGVLYEITADDLEHLELTEGVRIGHYDRTAIDVQTTIDWSGAASRMVEAVTLTSDVEESLLRPTSRYMELLLAGAAEHGLPKEWIETLGRIETDPESEEAAAIRPLLDDAMKKHS